MSIAVLSAGSSGSYHVQAYITIASVLLATLGVLYLSYEVLDRQNHPYGVLRKLMRALTLYVAFVALCSIAFVGLVVVAEATCPQKPKGACPSSPGLQPVTLGPLHVPGVAAHILGAIGILLLLFVLLYAVIPNIPRDQPPFLSLDRNFLGGFTVIGVVLILTDAVYFATARVGPLIIAIAIILFILVLIIIGAFVMAVEPYITWRVSQIPPQDRVFGYIGLAPIILAALLQLVEPIAEISGAPLP